MAEVDLARVSGGSQWIYEIDFLGRRIYTDPPLKDAGGWLGVDL